MTPDQCRKVKYEWSYVFICMAGLYKPRSMSAITIIVLRFGVGILYGIRASKDWNDYGLDSLVTVTYDAVMYR